MKEYLYTPFGEMFVEKNVSSGVDVSTLTRFFTNQMYDEKSKLYFYNARYYDPDLGSFLTADPGMSGMNHYGYASANPIRYSDPTGLGGEGPDGDPSYSGYESSGDDPCPANFGGYDDSDDSGHAPNTTVFDNGTGPEYSEYNGYGVWNGLVDRAETFQAMFNAQLTNDIIEAGHYSFGFVTKPEPDYKSPNSIITDPFGLKDLGKFDIKEAPPAWAPNNIANKSGINTSPSLGEKAVLTYTFGIFGSSPLSKSNMLGIALGGEFNALACLSIRGGNHKSIDMGCYIGTSVYSTAKGVVVFAGPNGNWGNQVIISHGHNVYTTYSHLSSIHAVLGKTVERGEEIGRSGRSPECLGMDPHLDYGVIINDYFVDPAMTLPSWYNSFYPKK